MWRLFRDKYGPLNPIMRFDSAVARAGALFLKDKDPKHLMPYPINEAVLEAKEQTGSLRDVFNLLKGVAKKSDGQ